MWALDVGLELGLGERCLEGGSGRLMCLDSEEGSGSVADLKTEQASHYMHMEMVCSKKCLIEMPLILWIHKSICLRPPGKVALVQRGKKANGRRL